MPTHDEIFEKVQSTLVDALGWTRRTSPATPPSKATWGRVDRLPRHRLPPRAELRDQDPPRRALPRERRRRPRDDPGRQADRQGARRDEGRGCPTPTSSTFAANPEVEKIGDLYTVDMLVQYVAEQARGLSRPAPGRPATPRIGPTRPGRRRELGPAARGRPVASPLPHGRASSTMRWIWIDKFLEFRSGQFARADQEPDPGRGAPARPLPGLPGHAGLADHRGAGPDRRHPRRRGRRVRREGRPGQDPPRRVLRRRLRGRPAHLRGDADRPPERGGGRRGARRSSKGSSWPTSRSSSPTSTTPGRTRSSARRTSSSPSNCSASSTWPRPRSARAGPRRPRAAADGHGRGERPPAERVARRPIRPVG